MLFVGNDFEKDALVKHFRKQGLKDIDEVIAEEGRLVREANSRTGLIWGISLACGVLSYFFVPNIFISIIAYPLSFVFRVFGVYYLDYWVYAGVVSILVLTLVYLYLSKSRVSNIRKAAKEYCSSIGLDAAWAGSRNETEFLIGRVQSANDQTVSDTHVVVGKDVFGNLAGSSYNTHRKYNSSWLYDLENKKEVKYSSEGESIARPGHDMGVASYRGRPVLEYNLSTGDTYNFESITGRLLDLKALLVALGCIFLGWVLFPVFFLIVLPLTIKKGVPFYIKDGGGFPGCNFPQILGSVSSGLITLGVYIGILASIDYRSVELFFGALAVGLVALFVVSRIGIKKTLGLYLSYLSYCKKELDVRYARLRISGS